jgi:hypothetical protein
LIADATGTRRTGRTTGLLAGRWAETPRGLVSHRQDLEELSDTLLERFGQGRREDIALLAPRRL